MAPLIAPAITYIDGPKIVDGENWYTVEVNRNASAWLHKLKLDDDRIFVGYSCALGDLFDLPEDLFILTKLKWS